MAPCVHTQNSLPQLWGIITLKQNTALISPTKYLKQTTISKITITLDRVSGRLETAEENISEFENMAIENIQNKRQGGREFYKMSRVSVSCGMTSSHLIRGDLESLKYKRERSGQRKVLRN